MSSQIGLIGLGTMGSALARNIASHKYSVVVYNRTADTTNDFITQYGNEFLQGKKTLPEFTGSLKNPRTILIMVDAGKPVDAVIESLKPLLSMGDLIVDCGNSNYHDTARRADELKKTGILFMGCGVSGGEEGALKGPSIMPSGDKTGWQKIKPIFEAIAAKDFSGKPCVTYIGEGAAGHYVKMVHNGIEYGVMQLMAEAYDLLRTLYKMKAPEIADIFSHFQKGKLESYLFEIAIPILKQKDALALGYLIDHILDKAGQKGTGKWTVIDAAERGIAIPSIAEAVFARVISSEKELRMTLSKQYKNKSIRPTIYRTRFIKLLEEALFAAMISCYAQGFALISKTAQEKNWQIELGEIARIWEGGCIIRAKILKTIHEAYSTHSGSDHLLAIPTIARSLKKSLPLLQEIVATGAKYGIALPVFSTSLSYLLGMTTVNGPANFIQGLRDYFGSHTYERTDQDGSFHTEWK